MSFAVIDPKFLIMIDNYTSHDKRFFGARYATSKPGKLRESKFSILSLFFLSPLINTLSTVLVPLLVYTSSTVVGFLSISHLILRFYDFFLILQADPKSTIKVLKCITLKINYMYNFFVITTSFHILTITAMVMECGERFILYK